MAVVNKVMSISEQEYLTAERKAEHKSEYFRGEVFAMSGASRNHNRIAGNFYAFLHRQLAGKGCFPYGSDLRVHVPANSLYTYLDITVVCGKEQFLDDEFDTLLNPVFICEVLSRSTMDYDKGGKFSLYRSIESLQEYWVISSLEPRVEKHVKQEGGAWLLTDFVSLDQTITLEALSIDISLRDVFMDVEFVNSKE
jgi:Uma2 family endonuclease